MGRRGPPRVPLQVLKARDSPVAKKRVKSGVPVPRPGQPNCPQFVPREARRYWRHVIGHLDGLGVLARIDRNVLGRYCTQLWMYQRAVKVVEEKGEVTLDKNSIVRDRPEVGRLLKISEGLLRIEKEFGMTASARSSLLREAGGKPKKAEKDRFFESQA